MAHLFIKLSKQQFVERSCSRLYSGVYSQKLLYPSIYRATLHFNDFYNKIYGRKWPGIREALLNPQTKYVAVINNYSDPERIENTLQCTGAMNMKSIYDVYVKQSPPSDKRKKKKKRNVAKEINDKSIETPAILSQKDIPLKSIELTDIETDDHRIIDPSIGPFALNEFIPATKVKGMDDYVMESDHYKYYEAAANFSVEIREEENLSFPEHLKVYTYEESNYTRFPNPTLGSTGYLDYYLFDGGSIFPVLALDLKHGDKVLDMCAGPGGKTITILQTLVPKLLVANDISHSRINRVKSVIQQFVPNSAYWDDILFITKNDACAIEDKDLFNKILCDVPCTTDRHTLNVEENNIFNVERLKERLTLPEKQAGILAHALKLVTLGGTVVYSTCSLSPIQNDGVVSMALKQVWEENNYAMIVKDMTKALEPLNCLYEFGDFGLKYGHIVIPTAEKNMGPMYFCKIQRVK